MAAAPATPLSSLEIVVLDTETTGLDVATARIVQIAALHLKGGMIEDGDGFDVLVNPGLPIPAESARVHGILDADVADKPGIAAVLPDLAAFIGDRILVGHSIHYDLALLRAEAKRAGVVWREPRTLDVAWLLAGMDRGVVDTSLDSMALTLAVPVTYRHTAMGDVRTTAGIYTALLPRLSAAGIRTLGEAETTQRRATDLIARQEQAGWFDKPGDRPDLQEDTLRAGHQKAVDSFLYRQRLADVMSSPVVTTAPGVTLREAAHVMDDRGFGCLFVDPRVPGGPPGILTERDLLRAMARRGPDASEVKAGDVATYPVITAPADTYLYRGLGLMARRNLRYLGVSAPDGSLAGIFTLRTLLRERALALLTVGDEMASAITAADLAQVQAALHRLAGGLLADGLAAPDVAAVIAAEGRAMTARAAELAEAEMQAQGLGPAPAPYAILVLGSGGRGESLLAPDQDNALVVADSYNGDLASGDDWFTRFSHRFTEILDQAGIPLCKGGVMARNRAWRRTMAEWDRQLADWAARPNPQNLLNVDIFYDFVAAHVSGPEGARLADDLRHAATRTAQEAPALVRAMGEAAGAHNPPLGMFGRIRKDDTGRVDLKGGGLLPITAGARAVALRHGIEALSTPERLRGAVAAAGRAETDADLIIDAHKLIQRLILSQQIADIAAGVKPGSRVHLASLNHRDHDRLKEALSRVSLIQDMLRDLIRA
jgi:signal-transduction protein with cAMP-binding, CBS, and nucleotidyltransferase domain/DNA polymerase III epsilon subunit-like protein